ncbi:MAG: hypothetical protein ACRD4F_04270, partial [Candidatus Angelobacter sp.]
MSESIDDLLADLNATFGKPSKKKASPPPPHKALNKSFHENNPQLQKGSGKAPERRLNPEDSSAWKPVAKVTHLCIQECATCSDCIEFIGGEFIRFRSIQP